MNRNVDRLLRSSAPKPPPCRRARLVPARMMVVPGSGRGREQAAAGHARALALALAVLCLVAALFERGGGAAAWWLIAASVVSAIPMARSPRRSGASKP